MFPRGSLEWKTRITIKFSGKKTQDKSFVVILVLKKKTYPQKLTNI